MRKNYTTSSKVSCIDFTLLWSAFDKPCCAFIMVCCSVVKYSELFFHAFSYVSVAPPSPYSHKLDIALRYSLVNAAFSQLKLLILPIKSFSSFLITKSFPKKFRHPQFPPPAFSPYCNRMLLMQVVTAT